MDMKTKCKVYENIKMFSQKDLLESNIKELEFVIDLVRKMPNADDRHDLIYKNGLRRMTLDGGSIHRFTLIKILEDRIKVLLK